MATLDVYNRSGEIIHQKEFSDLFINTPVHSDVLHQCVVAHLANQRSGTASTKSRSEVKGSGRKLHRQKGTGRARVGDSGSPTRFMAELRLDQNSVVIVNTYPRRLEDSRSVRR